VEKLEPMLSTVLWIRDGRPASPQRVTPAGAVNDSVGRDLFGLLGREVLARRLDLDLHLGLAVRCFLGFLG
jgi:hypothetical protein